MKKSISGFTIVELLIVIVVIAILAAISVVAYSGMSDRAYVSKIDSEVNILAKQLQLAAVDTGSYPRTDSTLKPIMQAAGVWEATRTAEWSYLYCTDGQDFAVFPTNDKVDRHNESAPDGETWRVYTPGSGWGEIVYDSDAYPSDSTRARDLCAGILPTFTWQRWFSAITI